MRAFLKRVDWGVVFFGVLLLGVSSQIVWSATLSEDAPRATLIERGARGYGGTFEVDGVRYSCRGGGVSKVGDEVAYDLSFPRRCRNVKYLRRPDLLEMLGMAVAAPLALIAFGFGAMRQFASKDLDR